jgi:hypothetical protein
MRPGHQWLREFGDDDTSCEKEFNLSHHTWEDNHSRDTHFYSRDRALVIKR